jgi:hypothetical protein
MQRWNSRPYMSGVPKDPQTKRSKRTIEPLRINTTEAKYVSSEQHRLRMLARSRRGKHVRRMNLEFWASLTPEQRKAEVKRRFKKS